ncbi:MAG: ribosome biogenesis protein [Promethearchaeota archaeon]|nr:MAG: ribosome biogenesis protein [Candidatus Lokiarchaeota archaeon]
MPKILYFCPKCNTYTLSPKECTKCGTKVKTPHPPKYSPQDKYQKYRIPIFKENNKKEIN